MSEHENQRVELPSSWLAYADSKALKNVGAVWLEHVEWMTKMGHALSADAWKRWVDRRVKMPDEKAAKQFPLYRQPEEWEREKASRDQAVAFGVEIIDALNAIGGTPVELEFGPVSDPSGMGSATGQRGSQRSVKAPFNGSSDPLCRCGRIMLQDASTCGRCPPSSGTPALPAAETNPVDTDVAQTSDAGDFDRDPLEAISGAP